MRSPLLKSSQVSPFSTSQIRAGATPWGRRGSVSATGGRLGAGAGAASTGRDNR